MLFDHPDFDDHREVRFVADSTTGLRAILAVHRTRGGRPGVGGIRFRPYGSDEEALTDALRLSRSMTYKAVLAGLPVGGAKGERNPSRNASMNSSVVRSKWGWGAQGPQGLPTDDCRCRSDWKYSQSPSGFQTGVELNVRSVVNSSLVWSIGL